MGKERKRLSLLISVVGQMQIGRQAGKQRGKQGVREAGSEGSREAEREAGREACSQAIIIIHYTLPHLQRHNLKLILEEQKKLILRSVHSGASRGAEAII